MQKIKWNIQGAFLLAAILLGTSSLVGDEAQPPIGSQTEESEAGSSLTIPQRLPPKSERQSEEESRNPNHVKIDKKNFPIPHVVTTRIPPENYQGRNQQFSPPIVISNPFMIPANGLETGHKIDLVEISIRRANGETTVLFDTVFPVQAVTRNSQGKIEKLILMGDAELQKQLAQIPMESLQFRIVVIDQKNDVITTPEPQITTDAESLLKWALAVRREQGQDNADDVILSSDDSRRLLIDPEKLELHENYILNPIPLDSPGWRASFEALQSVGEGTRRSKLLRVFLEDPQPEEQITLKGQKSIKMFYQTPKEANSPIQGAPRDKNSKIFYQLDPGHSSSADGMYHEISPGQYSGFSYFSRDSGSLKIASAYHLPALIELPPPEEEVGAFGEVMLLRPKWHELSTMLVTLTDAEGQPVKDWHFSYGPITFGGSYGYTKTLSNQGMAIVEGLAPQNFLVGFSEKPLAKFRSNVELKPGHLTRIAFRLDANGELLEPNVSHYPWNDMTEKNETESPAVTE
ncbi:hypothetical protein [uncultured Rubinisphaera sp.]|uniref:hypothetical protein n=1 Tax=uncultured Rubinisphaera sp. TaxID=1678686 RepID=UPI0030D98D86